MRSFCNSHDNAKSRFLQLAFERTSRISRRERGGSQRAPEISEIGARLARREAAQVGL